MGLVKFNFRSAALSLDTEVFITYPTDKFAYFPPDQPRHHIMPGAEPKKQMKPGMKFQTVYVPLAAATDPTHLFHYTNIEQYADDNMVMVVAARMCNSFGVDTCYGIEYSTYLTEELPVYIQTLFASSPRREDNFIAGFAAGGNTALYNAVKCPELYAACVDMSGGIGESFDLEKVRRIHEKGPFALIRNAYPPADEVEGSVYDMRYLTEKNKAEGKPLPELIFIRGAEEGRIGEFVEKDAEMAAELGYKTSYYNVPGGKHNDIFWNEQWKKIFDEYLPLKREPIFL